MTVNSKLCIYCKLQMMSFHKSGGHILLGKSSLNLPSSSIWWHNCGLMASFPTKFSPILICFDPSEQLIANWTDRLSGCYRLPVKRVLLPLPMRRTWLVWNCARFEQEYLICKWLLNGYVSRQRQGRSVGNVQLYKLQKITSNLNHENCETFGRANFSWSDFLFFPR